MIVELTPSGWLDTHKATRLSHDVMQAIEHGCTAIIISGTDLRYLDVLGLAGLGAVIADAHAAAPHIPIWLCHISPDLRAAATLAALDTGIGWHLASDLVTAHECIAQHAAQSTALEAFHGS